jgi:hypothetical protein
MSCAWRASARRPRSTSAKGALSIVFRPLFARIVISVFSSKGDYDWQIEAVICVALLSGLIGYGGSTKYDHPGFKLTDLPAG